MTDAARSQNMARIRGRDTTPEMILRRALWARGIRYRINYRVPGCRPDIVFPGKQIAVFVDGCFWHGCPDHYVRPRSRTDFWDEKLRSNVERDRRQTMDLGNNGWNVLRFWEHEVHIALEFNNNKNLGWRSTIHPGTQDLVLLGDLQLTEVQKTLGEIEAMAQDANLLAQEIE